MSIRFSLETWAVTRVLPGLCLFLGLISVTHAAAFARGASTESLDLASLLPGRINLSLSRVQIIHSAPETGLVDIYVDAIPIRHDFNLLRNDFGYLEATPFVPLPAGTHTIDIVAGDAEDDAAPLWTHTQVFFPEVNYAFILVDQDSGLGVLVQEGVRREAEGDDIEFIIVHAVPDAPSLDIRLLDPADSYQVVELLVNNLAFGEVTSYRRLPPADYFFQVTNANNSIVFTRTRFDLPSVGWKTLIIVVAGRLADASVPLWLFGFNVDGNLLTPIIVNRSNEATRPETFVLRGNYPNPFNRSTTIAFDLPEAAVVRVVLFDVLGRAVLATPAQRVDAGINHTVELDASALPSGTYLYHVAAETSTRMQRQIGRLVLAR